VRECLGSAKQPGHKVRALLEPEAVLASDPAERGPQDRLLAADLEQSRFGFPISRKRPANALLLPRRVVAAIAT
jgi:hypothetical protein